MKILGVIPSRYGSSRLPGKPLIEICGKPMLWWVYTKLQNIKEFSEIVVATDDERIEKVCIDFGFNVVMTKKEHPTHIHRIEEVASKIEADYYCVICGDEPLLEETVIQQIIPKEKNNDLYYVHGLMRLMDNPTQVIDPANIKIITDNDGRCIALSRAPIPFPYKSTNFQYKKIMGLECYNKCALQKFADLECSFWENIEDITLLRFLEHNIPIYYSLTDSKSISVDTINDLRYAESIIKEKK